jgi:hypothetical protein
MIANAARRKPEWHAFGRLGTRAKDDLLILLGKHIERRSI